jgi:hypothetical protein
MIEPHTASVGLRSLSHERFLLDFSDGSGVLSLMNGRDRPAIEPAPPLLLTAIRRTKADASRHTRWIFDCDCVPRTTSSWLGAIRTISMATITRGCRYREKRQDAVSAPLRGQHFDLHRYTACRFAPAEGP